MVGLISRTGFATTKGKLVRSILLPRPTQFKFYSDSFKFIGVIGFLASFAFGYLKLNIMLSVPNRIHFSVAVVPSENEFDLVLKACELIVVAYLCRYAVYRFIVYGVEVAEVIVRVLDLISTAVPAALPVAMTVGTAFAIARYEDSAELTVVQVEGK